MPVSKFHPSIDKIELKKIPKKGDENYFPIVTLLEVLFLIEKRSPRKGTKTGLPFVQMSPYVSREDPREGDERYLTWQDSGDQDSERKKDPLHGAGCLMDEEVSL